MGPNFSHPGPRERAIDEEAMLSFSIDDLITIIEKKGIPLLNQDAAYGFVTNDPVPIHLLTKDSREKNILQLLKRRQEKNQYFTQKEKEHLANGFGFDSWHSLKVVLSPNLKQQLDKLDTEYQKRETQILSAML